MAGVRRWKAIVQSLGERTVFRAEMVSGKVAGIYLIAAGAWILLSDRILLWYFEDPARLTNLQTAKGWFFVFATAGMLAWLVRYFTRELHREKDLLDNIISHIPLYVFWKGRDGRYMGCNQRFATVAGVGKKEHIRGKTDYDLAWSRADAELMRQGDRQVMDKRKLLLEVEETRRLVDGQPAILLTSKVPLEDESSQVIGVLGISADITLRKREEKALRESERRLSTLMEHLPGMAYRCRNDRERTLEFASAGCLALTGYVPADLIGNRKVSFASIVHPEDLEAMRHKIQAALENRRPFRIGYRIRTARGDERQVWEAGVGVFSEQDGLVALEGFVSDITQRGKAEAAAERATQ